jgi:flavodoxin
MTVPGSASVFATRRNGRNVMSTELYYFTGTGNSLAVARDIARKTDGRLISIPSLMDQESVESDADVLGIVCRPTT